MKHAQGAPGGCGPTARGLATPGQTGVESFTHPCFGLLSHWAEATPSTAKAIRPIVARRQHAAPGHMKADYDDCLILGMHVTEEGGGMVHPYTLLRRPNAQANCKGNLPSVSLTRSTWAQGSIPARPPSSRSVPRPSATRLEPPAASAESAEPPPGGVGGPGPRRGSADPPQFSRLWCLRSRPWDRRGRSSGWRSRPTTRPKFAQVGPEKKPGESRGGWGLRRFTWGAQSHP